MAKQKRPAKKSRGQPAAKRVMAKAKPTRTNAVSAAKIAKARAGREKLRGEAIPTPEVSPSQIDTLVATIEGLSQMMNQRFASIESRLGGIEQQQGAQQETAPVAPSPAETAFAMMTAVVAEMQEAIRGVRSHVQQSHRDTERDVPLRIRQSRLLFAGACKTLGIVGPTPAIIGRIMHDKAVFSPTDNRSPRALLELIYVKGKQHLAEKVQSLLEMVGGERTSDGPCVGNERRTSSGVGPKVKSSSKLAELLGNEFDDRFRLITNTGCGKQVLVSQGKRTHYVRHLTQPGREMFDGWPEWSDATGGIDLVDEPEIPSGTPTTSAPDAKATALEPPPPQPSPATVSPPQPSPPAPT